MLNHKGFTLLETLFAFCIYLCIILLITSVIQNVQIDKKKVSQLYNEIRIKEEIVLKESDIAEAIKMVLH